VNREKERKRWCMHNSCKREVFTHAACFAVPVCCCRCMWLPVLVPPLHTHVAGAINVSHTRYMHR
jgi:hypothetical protein